MTIINQLPQATSDSTRPATEDAVTYLQFGEELDLATADRFELAGLRALAGRSDTVLAIDLSTVTFIDAAGIGSLVAINNNARLQRNAVQLIDPAPCVRRVLELTTLTSAFPIRAVRS